MEVARFKHDCTGCTFLGFDEENMADLYYHEAFPHCPLPDGKTALTLIIRYSDDTFDITSFWAYFNKGTQPIFYSYPVESKFEEAFDRAIALIKKLKGWK